LPRRVAVVVEVEAVRLLTAAVVLPVGEEAPLVVAEVQ
jgi:hypothetical protein